MTTHMLILAIMWYLVNPCLLKVEMFLGISYRVDPRKAKSTQFYNLHFHVKVQILKEVKHFLIWGLDA